MTFLTILAVRAALAVLLALVALAGAHGLFARHVGHHTGRYLAAHPAPAVRPRVVNVTGGYRCRS